MSWRIVVISSTSKLDLKLGYLVIRNEKTTKVHLGEIHTLVIESTAVSLTAALLNEMVKRKIKIIFCDERRNPSSELLPYYGSHDTSSKIRSQIKWRKAYMRELWQEIVKEKIRNQRDNLKRFKCKNFKLLDEYISQVEINDISNREGHAAKVYFNSLFGMEFSRSLDISINHGLNYGYSLILSCFNKEIVSNGYLTTLGIFHDNIFNQFNLSCDFMEPFRPFVDRLIYEMKLEKFEKEEKIKILDILNKEVMLEGKQQHMTNAIKIFCKSVFDSLNENDISLIRFPKDEL